MTQVYGRLDDIWSTRLYMVLAGIFIAALIASNLIFQKFFIWSPFGLYTFEISVGIIPYPITFLVTDIISEIYGKRRADQVVITGLVASLFIVIVVMIADAATAAVRSPVSGEMFHKVFGLFGPAVFASMVAYLAAQFIDIRVYHFWKKFTNGKHLWLRNNGSTMFSQLVDTVLVLSLMVMAGVLEWDDFGGLLMDGFLFKILVAAADTPVLYLVVYLLRKKFNLQPGEELPVPGEAPAAG